MGSIPRLQHSNFFISFCMSANKKEHVKMGSTG